MRLTPHVVSVEARLSAAAQAGDESARRAAAVLAIALEPAIRLGMINALAELAAEITDELGDRVVELRLERGEPRVSVTPATGPADAGDYEEEPDEAGAELSRVTLRLPESLKSEAERAAAAQGISLNTWVTRAVKGSLRGSSARPSPARGTRLRGWVQA
jgi:hypothetical protein